MLTRRLVITAVVLASASVASASLIARHRVDSMHSLYYEDWGHPYTETWDGVTRESNERSGINRGRPAQVVSAGRGMPFDFSTEARVKIKSSGKAPINGQFAYGPKGVGGPLWRELRLYSMIGIWSRSATEIDPIGDPFFAAGPQLLDVPLEDSVYLFLAFNDGIFSDNWDPPKNGRPGYRVKIARRKTRNGTSALTSAVSLQAGANVPEPASAALLLVGLGAVAASRARRRRG